MSDDTPTIPPALTAEDWDTIRTPYAGDIRPALAIAWAADVYNRAHERDRMMRRLGALGLLHYFSHEDVALIRRHAEQQRKLGAHSPERAAEAEALASIADRIAALLPPEGT